MSWAALGVVYVVWGTTYLAIRVGVRHVPPLLFAGVRYVAAGAILYPIALRLAARRGSAASARRPSVNEWIAGGVIGVVLLVAGNGGLSVAEKSLPSGFAAVLVATVPLWMIVFARILESQPITWKKALSLAVGLGGVAILVGGGAWTGRASGIIIVLGASVAWGFGSVLGHRLTLSSNVLFAAAIEMVVGGAVLLVVASGSGEVSHFHFTSMTMTTWVALVYLIGPGIDPGLHRVQLRALASIAHHRVDVRLREPGRRGVGGHGVLGRTPHDPRGHRCGLGARFRRSGSTTISQPAVDINNL